jgi:Zn-dependent protease
VFRHVVPIGRIAGISIDLDYSWFMIFGLLTWVLASAYYPAEFKNWSIGLYWFMGAITAVMLFVSVLIHELGHSLVARRSGLNVSRITLFIFGGLSHLETEPTDATAEFWIAVVGPLISFALAATFRELEPIVASSPELLALCEYLALINLILAVFNLVPGFPLDGGRVFRAIVWRLTGNYRRATAIAAGTGRFFGFLLILFGIWRALAGDFLDGLWIAFIGWFLESAAGSLLQQEGLKTLLGDHTVLELMKRDYPKVNGDVTLQELVDRRMVPENLRYLIVSDGPGAAHNGLLTLSAIQHAPRSAWAATTASQAMVPLQKLDTVTPNVRLWSAIEKMGHDGVNELPVIDRSEIVGVLSRDDVLQYLRMLHALAA